MIINPTGIRLVILTLVLLLPMAAGVPGQGRNVIRWKPVLYGELNGERALLYNDSLLFGKLALGDLDGDGDMDLLVGKKDGRISRFNREKGGDWRLVEEAIPAVMPVRTKKGLTKNVRRVISLGAHAAPALADLDMDGDLDLVVGTANGDLFYFRNEGNEALASFRVVTSRFVLHDFGKRIIPFFADIDNDLDQDLFLGTGDGRVYLLINKGNKKKPEYCAKFPPKNARPDQPPPCLPTPLLLARIAPETHATPSLVDWDLDGDLDLFIGKRNGTIAYYQNRGSSLKPRWLIEQKRFLSIDNGGFAAPAFYDVNGDGRPELLVGNSTNQIFLYTNKDTGSLLDVWQASSNLLLVRRIGQNQERVIITSGDLDKDGDLDLILGDKDGNLRWVENSGDKKVPVWKILKNNIFEGTPRHNTAPFLVDEDQDGDLDLLVGGRDGNLWLVRNNGSPKSPHWILAETRYGGIEVGSNSHPVMVDMDQDGDLDLFVGNSRGLVIYYRNEGTRRAPDFRLTSTRFAGISVGQTAAPSFFDWDRDKKLDMVVGNRAGRLTLTTNSNPPKDDLLRSWSLKSRFWENLQVKGYSSPHFGDFNGDGNPDLMVGDGEGNIRLWFNAGVARKVAKKAGAEGKSAAPAAQEEQLPVVPAGGLPETESVELSAVPAGGLAESTPGDLAEALGGGTPLPLTAVPAESAGAAAAAANLLFDEDLFSAPLPPEFVLAGESLGNLKFNSRTVPDFLDLDGDGDLDMVVGTGKGKLILFQNDGSRKVPVWKRITDHFAGFKHGRNASPLFADLDGDNKPELLVGTENGRVFIFKNISKNEKSNFVIQEDTLAGIKVGSNASPAVGSAGGGKGPLVLVGDLSGRMAGYTREGEKTPLAFKRNHRQFLGLDVGLSAAPYFGDMDRDGVAELMIGSDRGVILNFIKIPPTVKNPWGWQKEREFLKTLKFPPGSTPRLVDIDDDKDMDMIVGTEKGTLYFYRNDAIAQDGIVR